MAASDVVQIRRPAVPTTPLVLDSPHSGKNYPADFQPACGPDRYRRAEDMDVDVLFEAAPAVGGVLLAALFPRIYCDVNRSMDDLEPRAVAGALGMELRPTAKARLGKGVIWQAVPPDGGALYAAPLDAATVRRRLDTCWLPYHQALGALLDETEARFGRVFHLDCHSMQSVSNVMHEEGAGIARPDIVLSDRDGTTSGMAFRETVRRLLESQGFAVAVNDPYKGAEIVRRHGAPQRSRHSLQIEINRRLYMDEARIERSPSFERTQRRLGRFLTALAAALHGL